MTDVIVNIFVKIIIVGELALYQQQLHISLLLFTNVSATESSSQHFAIWQIEIAFLDVSHGIISDARLHLMDEEFTFILSYNSRFYQTLPLGELSRSDETVKSGEVVGKDVFTALYVMQNG